MDWNEIQTRIPEAVRTILGDAFDVGWKDRASRWRNPSHVLLSVLDTPARGRDERRYTAEGPDDVRERVYGVRRLVVQFEVEHQAQSLGESAQATAEALRAGLHRSDVADILEAAGLGVAIVQPGRTVNYPDDSGRWRSVVLFDVFFNAHVSHTGPLVPVIKQIEFSGAVENGPDMGPETVSGS